MEHAGSMQRVREVPLQWEDLPVSSSPVLLRQDCVLLVLGRAGRHRLPAGNRLSIAVCRGMEAGSAHLLPSSLQPLLPSHKSSAGVLLHSREQADKQRCARVCVYAQQRRRGLANMDSRFSSPQWLCKGMKGLHQGKEP